MLTATVEKPAASAPQGLAGEFSAADRIAQATIIYDEARSRPRDEAIALIAARLFAAHNDGYVAGHMRYAEATLRTMSIIGDIL